MLPDPRQPRPPSFAARRFLLLSAIMIVMTGEVIDDEHTWP